ncbi:hypothetical protein [Bacteroides sp.]|uniref:hypothetical protein n=1 Tax=Bacteroides sp. TaxID=29523 RepID=UPI0023BE3C5C|nr:hypothetical protein [Bacteroides sp.]MDE6216958.1 hypothetical protein [Bacteroides sp.]
MKALKLLGIFIVFVGILILALNWGSLFQNASDEDDDFVPEDKIDITAKCQEIRDAWKAAEGWNEELYKKVRADIDRKKKMGMFSSTGYLSVNNALHESATNKACDAYLTALHDKDSFNDAQLNKHYQGVCSLKSYESLDGDLRVDKVEKRHTLYRKIRGFVSSRHNIVAQYDTATTQWTSFESHRQGILGTASNYRANSLYKQEMTHIPGFVQGLDENYLSDLTHKQRLSFYQGLSRQIVMHFQGKTPTPESVKQLEGVYRAFVTEAKTDGVSELAAFKITYQVPQNAGN